MIPVLIESKSTGASPWVFVTGRSRVVRVLGASPDDIVQLTTWLDAPPPAGRQGAQLALDKTYVLPKDVKAVRVAHLKASGQAINVDLLTAKEATDGQPSAE